VKLLLCYVEINLLWCARFKDLAALLVSATNVAEHFYPVADVILEKDEKMMRKRESSTGIWSRVGMIGLSCLVLEREKQQVEAGKLLSFFSHKNTKKYNF
jgi:hypothetical protein